jgi:hypothetical protein
MEQKARRGDIISVDRGLYRHYGIYVSDSCVITYGAKEADFGKHICVHATTLRKFAKGDRLIICRLPKSINMYRKLYTPDETVRRAQSRLGEENYNIVFNNCEHFAYWCKTGIRESQQVTKVIESIFPFIANEYIGENLSDVCELLMEKAAYKIAGFFEGIADALDNFNESLG